MSTSKITKIGSLLSMLILVLVWGCNNNEEVAFSTDLSISIDSVSYDYASISWERPDESSTYDVILSDQEIVTAIAQNTFEFTALEANSSYSGKIIATNNTSQRIIEEFEFQTLPIDLDFKIEKYNFNLDKNVKELWLSFGWNSFPDGNVEDIKYRFFVDDGEVTSAFNPKLKDGRFELSLNSYLFTESEEKKFTLSIESSEQSFTEEIVVKLPNSEDFPEIGFDLEMIYEGYTTVAFEIENFSSGFYEAYSQLSPSSIDPTPILNDNIVLGDLPISITPSRSEPWLISVVENINDTVTSKKTRSFQLKELKRLPDDDLEVNVYNIKSQSFNVAAFNVSNEDTYSPAANGPESFNIYLDDSFIGEHSCYFLGSGGSETIPEINNLTPNSTYKLKVEVDYGNWVPDSEYETIQLTTFKEFQVTTDSVALQTDLDTYIINRGSTSFDLVWKTDLGSEFTCSSPFTVDYEFSLFVDGVLFSNFTSDQRIVHVDELEPNTTYELTIECDLLIHGSVSETRSATQTVTTTN